MSEPRTILTVDIGNTALKVCVFEGDHLIQSSVGIIPDMAGVLEAVGAMLTFNSADGAAICSVGADPAPLVELLAGEYELPVVALNPETPLPVEVRYGTRTTLGADRVAAAVGVSSPDCPVLVVDAGTAVTADLVAGECFLGGNISPGLKLRFRSLADYTSRLPLVTPDGATPDFGHDTVTAIRSGVVRGLVAEIACDVERARKISDNLKIVLTGGDASFLAPLLREHNVEADIDNEAVGRGLVRIFNYNYPL
ncbi:MAG: type III pantothenate kinase [Muribaculaceae bacterium]|nr:type III pantothenate kinase [Muribaculaceae bacterium]